MKEFTFAVITYNQRAFIVEHLESVKRQIQMYGQNYHADFVLSDDCSKDDTVVLAEKWLAQNRSLFRNVTVIPAQQNQGIVANYLTALKHVKTCKFKILAGDDFYYKNDVVAAVYAGEFVISSTLRLYEEGLRENPAAWWQKEYLLTDKARLRRKLLGRMKYLMCLESPAVFWDASLADQGMYQALAPYKWIEDVPLWCYLLSKENLEVAALNMPLVVYRMTSGISQNTRHEKLTPFEEEVLLVQKNIQTHLNAAYFEEWQKFVRRVIKYLLKNDSRIRTFDANMALSEAQEYVAGIQSNAADWLAHNDGK